MTHRPRRSLGQNFLVDRGFRARIVEAVDIRPGETVVEIGPGRGGTHRRACSGRWGPGRSARPG